MSLETEVKSLIREMKDGDMAALYLKCDQRQVLILQPLLELIDTIPSGVKHREERIQAQKVKTLISETLDGVNGYELTPVECKQRAVIIETAWKEMLVRDEPVKAPTREQERYSLEKAFQQFGHDVLRDRKVITKRYNTKAIPHNRVIRNVFVQCEPFLTEEEIQRAGIDYMRVVQGYTFLPDQKIIVARSNMVPGDKEAYLQRVADKSDKPYTVVPMLTGEKGMIYGWVLPTPAYIQLFEEPQREINAWCPFSDNFQDNVIPDPEPEGEKYEGEDDE